MTGGHPVRADANAAYPELSIVSEPEPRSPAFPFPAGTPTQVPARKP